MQNPIFYIHSNHNSFFIEFNNIDESNYYIYLELITIFWSIEKGVVELVNMQKMNKEIRKKYTEYILKYKKKAPHLNRLKSSLDKINENEYYYTSNKSTYTAEEIIFIGNMILAHNEKTNDREIANRFKELMNRNDGLFCDLFKNYDVNVFDSSQRITIGESNKQKRICRFCNNGMNTDTKVRFDLKAHAFSEALGNKSIVLNEECDTCNGKFGSNIEEDFINYLNIYRVFFKVKGKKGVPTIKFKNGGIIKSVKNDNIIKDNLEKDTDEIMVVMSQNIQHNNETGDLSILLESSQKLAAVNIYKTLCKYALSVIDKNQLTYLQDTINWLKTNSNEEIKLPKVAILISNEMYVDTPVLGLYIRNNNEYDYPHIVVEFKFKSLIFVSIIPFSNRDKKDFTDDEVYNKFWKIFKHYSSIDTWAFNDFSSVEKKLFQFNLNMNNASNSSTKAK